MSDSQRMINATDASGLPGPVFVGRERELAELRSGLNEALSGRGQVFLLVGEPGIGKTRLAEEVTRAARTCGAQVLWGRCWEGGGAPAFWPWIQVLRTLIGERDPQTLAPQLGSGASLVAALVPELRQHIAGIGDEPHSSTMTSEHARFPLFDATTTFFQRAAAEQPLVIVLDDLHAADEPSLLLLQFVARNLRGARLLLLGTYRDLEIQRQPERSRLLSEVARNGHRLPLSGWSETDVARFIEQAFTLSPTPALVSALHRTTDGNPFFVDEVVRLLVAEGQGVLVDDATVETLRIPHGIREVTRARLRPLSPACQRVATVAAVIGRDFDFLCLQHVCELPAAQLLELLDEAEAAGVLTAAKGAPARYTFTHMLIRQTLYDDLAQPERLRRHQDIGTALELLAASNPDAHVAEIAHHFFQAASAGSVDKAISYGVRAGQRAADLLAYEEAAAHYARALEALALKRPPDVEQHLELLLALGDAQARAWQNVASHATFSQAADLARRSSRPDHFARAVLGLGGAGLGLPRGGVVDPALVALLEEALAHLDLGSKALRARVTARLAVELFFSDAEERRAALSKQAVELARGSGDSAALAYVVNARHFALWNSRDVEERLAIANEGIQLAEQGGDRDLALQAHIWRLLDVIEMGAAGSWERELDVCCRLAEQLREPRYLSIAATLRGMRALWLGHFNAIDNIGQEIFALAERAQDDSALATVGFQAGMAKRALGQFEVVEAVAQGGVQRFPNLPVTRCLFAVIQMDLGRAAAARSEYERLAANDFADLIRANGLDSLLPWLAELCAYVADGQGAQILYERLQRFASGTISFGPRFCFGPATHALGLLARTMGRWDVAAQHFEDALARSTALGGRPAMAATGYEYARLLLIRRAPGDADRALELAAQALTLAQELGMSGLSAKVRTLLDEAELAARRTDLQPREAVSRAVGDNAVRPGESDAPADNNNDANKARVIRFPDKRSGRVRAAAPVASGRDPSPRSADRADTAEYVFRLEGEFWSVGESSAPIRLKDTKGLRYIEQLLRHPGKEFHAVDLAAEERPGDLSPIASQTDEHLRQHGVRAGDLGDLGALLDPRAKSAYKHRLRNLREELEEATRFNDVGRAARAQQEIDFISRELARAVGLHGRSRAGASHAERARVNVTRAIKAVVKRIGARNAPLGRYLINTIKTGTFCSHTPDPHQPIGWRF